MTVAMERKLISDLIEVYKSCTCLWRIKDPDYKNKELKHEAYESLLQLIKKYNENCTMDDLKRKIANLRTCYLREFKKVMDAKRYGGIYEPSLWYYKSLEFLNDQHHGEDRVRLGRSYADNSDEDNESNENQILVYEDQEGSEDKDSCSTEPDQSAVCNLQQTMLSGESAVCNLQQTMLSGEQASAAAAAAAMAAAAGTVTGTVTGSTRRPKKRRRRILDATGPDRANWYSSSVAVECSSYDPQILGGVGDPGEPPVADYYDGFGRYAANELRQIQDRQSVIIAKRLVNEVLFLGQMGMLNVNTRIETPSGRSGGGGNSRKNATRPPSTDHLEDVTMAAGGHELQVEFMETS